MPKGIPKNKVINTGSNFKIVPGEPFSIELDAPKEQKESIDWLSLKQQMGFKEYIALRKEHGLEG